MRRVWLNLFCFLVNIKPILKTILKKTLLEPGDDFVFRNVGLFWPIT